MSQPASTGFTQDNRAIQAISFFQDYSDIPHIQCFPPHSSISMEELEKFEIKERIRDFHRANRELAEIVISTDNFGKLSVEFKMPHELALKKNLLDGRFLEVYRFVCSESKLTVWHIAWEAHGAYCDIWIDGEDMDPKYLAKAMERAGLPLRISRRKRTDVIIALYQWIIRSTVSKETPPRHGWYQRLDKCYDFADKKTITMKELRKKCQMMK